MVRILCQADGTAVGALTGFCASALSGYMDYLYDKWEGHKALCCHLSCVLPQAVAFQDTKSLRWSWSLGVSRKVLTERLEVVWQNAHVTVTGNTDEEWSAFYSLAEDLFGQIFRKYSGATRLAGTTRPQGSLPRPKPGQIGRTSASFAGWKDS